MKKVLIDDYETSLLEDFLKMHLALENMVRSI